MKYFKENHNNGSLTRREILKKTARTAGIVAAAGTLPTLITGCSESPYLNEVKYIQTSFTKDFLLKCRGGYLLIDTSYPDKYSEFVEKLSKMNIDISEIKYLLLTHHHDDHAGFASELVKNTGARIIVHKKALPFLEKGKSEIISKPLNFCVNAIMSIFSIFHEFKFPPLIPTKRDIIIDGNDIKLLKKIGVDGKILYTPGHSDDSISVLLPDGKAFVGDAAMDLFNICCCKHRPIFIQNLEEMFESWQKLIDAGAKIIYPAHGNPFPANELIPSMKEFYRK